MTDKTSINKGTTVPHSMHRTEELSTLEETQQWLRNNAPLTPNELAQGGLSEYDTKGPAGWNYVTRMLVAAPRFAVMAQNGDERVIYVGMKHPHGVVLVMDDGVVEIFGDVDSMLSGLERRGAKPRLHWSVGDIAA